MALNPELEEIFEAWLQSERCPPSERAKSEHQLNSLLDAIVAKGEGQFTPEQIKDCFWSQYKDWRAARRKGESVKVAQSAMKK
jgi:hypothetical protein